VVPARWEDFPAIWSIDFEFSTTCPTGRPVPHTFVALDLVSGREIRLVGDALRSTVHPPFDTRQAALLAYNFVAEASCFEVLGWSQPRWPIDLYVEHLASVNGLSSKDNFEKQEDDRRIGFRMIDAMRCRGLEVSSGDECHKKAMQLRAAEGEPFTAQEWRAIADYCGEDVERLARLFGAMRDVIDIPVALVRGRFMTAIAQQAHRGIPVDRGPIERFQAHRLALRASLIDATPGADRIYTQGRFSVTRFLTWTEEEEIGWPRLDTGGPALDREIVRCVTQLEPRAASFADLRSALSKTKNIRIPLRSDDRVRPNFMPYRTDTSRCKPRASEYLMLLPKWVRGWVCAPPGRTLALLDFQAEEVFVAAALSRDRHLLEDLQGDPYLGLAARAGQVPQGATKRTHGAIRGRFKAAMLGIIYGEKEWTLSRQLGVDVPAAREIINQFRRHYRTLWEWLESVVRSGYTSCYLESPLGWPLHVGPRAKPTKLRNHLIQSSGADVLRAACLFAQDDGLGTIGTLHDSILLEAGVDDMDDHMSRLAVAMARGAEAVIGMPIPVEVEFVAPRYKLEGEDAAFFAEVNRRVQVAQAATR
jgi:hypothetical protein